MAVPKDKIKAALDTKYRGKSLSKTFKEQFAATAADLIEDESGIDEYINNHDFIINLSISEADRRASEAATKARQDAADAAAGNPAKTDTPAEPEADPNMPAWAKQLLEQNKAMQAELSGFKQARTAETLQQRFEKDERLKGIPAELLHGRYPTKEEDFDAAVEATQQALKPFVERLATVDFGKDTPGAFGGGQPAPAGKVKEASDKELDALMANIPI